MVYETDFYTTRRPYRASPSMSSYTVSQTIVPSRQIRILPGIGKVHVVHSYDRLIPYIGHKRLTVVTARPHVYRVRPSVIVREIDRIAHKTRPYIYYSPTSSYLNSEPITFFDDETRFIRAQTASLLKKIHAPVPRVRVSWPITKIRYQYDLPLPARISSDDYIHRMLTPIRTVKQDIYNISHYYTEPIRRYIGTSHLACVRYGGNKAYSRRRNLTLQEIYAMQSDTVRNDIQLLSYYINANKERKALEGCAKAPNLPVFRPSRVFSKPQLMSDTNTEELKELREQRAERLKKIHDIEPAEVETARIKRSTKKQEEERLAEERALIEETVRKEKEQAKKEEARRAELVRQEALATQAAAERQAEIERKAELAKKAEAERAAELARIDAEKAEQVRIEEEKIQAELARQEEERQQLLRLEEIARQAEEEKEKELARQAAELAELARQEAELAEQARKEAELAELAKQEAELAELEKQEKELAELDRQDREAAEAEKQDAEIAEQQKEDAELAAAEAEAKILESNIPSNEQPAIEPDVCVETENEPIVEEPATPEAVADDSKSATEVVEEEAEEEEVEVVEEEEEEVA